MRIASVKQAFVSAYRDLIRHHTLQVAAALSYYFVLSVFPSLILLSAVVGWLREQHLFGNVLGLMCGELVAEAMLGRAAPELSLFDPARLL